MNCSPVESETAFIRSLDAQQRAYFLQREKDRSARLQASLRALAQGFSEVSALSGEALNTVLATAT